jgi:hypothetical protein
LANLNTLQWLQMQRDPNAPPVSQPVQPPGGTQTGPQIPQSVNDMSQTLQAQVGPPPQVEQQPPPQIPAIPGTMLGQNPQAPQAPQAPVAPPQMPSEMEDAYKNEIQRLKALQTATEEVYNYHPSLGKKILAAALGGFAGMANPQLGIQVGQAVRMAGPQMRAYQTALQNEQLSRQQFEEASKMEKSRMDIQKSQAEVAKYQSEVEIAKQKFPLEVAELQQRVLTGRTTEAKAQAELKKMSEAVVDPGLYTATVDGKKIPVRKYRIPGETADKIQDYQGNDVTSKVTDIRKTLEKEPTESESVLNAIIKKNNPGKDWDVNSAPPEARIAAEQEYEKMKGEPAAQRAAAAAAEREKTQQTRIDATALAASKRDLTGPMKINQNKLQTQIDTLQESIKAMDLGKANTVAANLAGIQTLRSAMAGSGSRITNIELGLAQGGKWAQFGGYLQQWSFNPATASKFTPEVRRQMEEYQKALLGEAKRVSDLNQEYILRIDSVPNFPGAQDELQKLREAYSGWVSNPTQQAKIQKQQQQTKPSVGTVAAPGTQSNIKMVTRDAEGNLVVPK